MRVWIRRLELQDFRNYESFELEPAQGLTVLLGPNAVGKTNVVEAIELVTQTTSFRNPRWSDLVREGAGRAIVLMQAESESGTRTEVGLAIENSRRVYRVNGAVKRAVIDAAGLVPAVVFTPDDLRMIKEGADRRRAALDSVGTQVSRAYGQLKAEYERVLRQRNALLRDTETSEAELRPWTELLAQSGTALTARRRSLTEKMAGRVSEEHEALSGGQRLTVAYTSGWSADEPTDETAMLEQLRARAPEERARRTTLVGPHRDDIRFEVGGRETRAFASQGQQRSAALAWKLAELDAIEDMSGRTPVLLLDDVMSELDEARRHALAERVGTRTQTIMTTTNLGYFDESLISKAKVVELS